MQNTSMLHLHNHILVVELGCILLSHDMSASTEEKVVGKKKGLVQITIIYFVLEFIFTFSYPLKT